ncbi:mitochondrial large subunit ribosomal protein-domain-containing protein [Hypoxylon argillaceum]|nr:mitochondrial large subunit ribosomal protein-domain-containing protein [Hypoxylon argillaceum]KAI1151641.1 mitochondrial large subunit ribosomal protein-domain-containing protein [Nemania diffusa]
MFFRSLRPLASRVTSPATTSFRSNTFLRPVGIRTVSSENTPETTVEAYAKPPEAVADSAPLEPNLPTTLPYFVGRNNLNNLSIYQKTKNGGTYKVTVLKNTKGQLGALRQDLKNALQLAESDINLNLKTQHILIKGHKRSEVQNFLLTLGF